MRPAPHARALAFQLIPAYLDEKPTYDLKDIHFYTAGNHFILHHLDYYFLLKKSMTIQEYITDQLRFWTLVEKTLDVLEWKLRSYTSHLPYIFGHFHQ